MATVSHYVHDSRRSWSLPSKLLSPSRFLQGKLIEFGIPAGSIAYVPIFIDFSEEPAENNHSAEYVLYFGRLAEKNGIEVLLEGIS
jgi:glycosyltransferase involved in cell wall biosynthesis